MKTFRRLRCVNSWLLEIQTMAQPKLLLPFERSSNAARRLARGAIKAPCAALIYESLIRRSQQSHPLPTYPPSALAPRLRRSPAPSDRSSAASAAEDGERAGLSSVVLLTKEGERRRFSENPNPASNTQHPASSIHQPCNLPCRLAAPKSDGGGSQNGGGPRTTNSRCKHPSFSPW